LNDAIGQLKTSSNDWLRAKDTRLAQFYSQGGYDAFSAGQSGVDQLREYIRNQRQHHKHVSFQATMPQGIGLAASALG
jgi:mevalonate pyrophosphate decarboxylase